MQMVLGCTTEAGDGSHELGVSSRDETCSFVKKDPKSLMPGCVPNLPNKPSLFVFNLLYPLPLNKSLRSL